ncbi:MAG: hypothetical protein JSW12_08095, partial [Deltaproteobacteria bacterium]
LLFLDQLTRHNCLSGDNNYSLPFFKASTKKLITLDQLNSGDTAVVVLVVEKKEGYRQSR